MTLDGKGVEKDLKLGVRLIETAANKPVKTILGDIDISASDYTFYAAFY